MTNLGASADSSTSVGKSRRIVGLIAALFFPGGGHFVVGRWRRGILWYLAVSVLAALVLLGATFAPLIMLVELPVALLAHVGAIVDFLRLFRSVTNVPSWWRVLGGLTILGLAGVIWDSTVKEYYWENYLKAYTIPSGAMHPTLLTRDYILTDKSAYRSEEPRRGDIVVFKYPHDERRDFIKRVIGLPGEEVSIRGRTVYINGKPLDEPYAIYTRSAVRSGVGYGPTVVPPESYFVLGDNRDNSQDSRYWGFVRREKIRGKAVLIYWSWDGEQMWPRWERIGRRID